MDIIDNDKIVTRESIEIPTEDEGASDIMNLLDSVYKYYRECSEIGSLIDDLCYNEGKSVYADGDEKHVLEIAKRYLPEYRKLISSIIDEIVSISHRGKFVSDKQQLDLNRLGISANQYTAVTDAVDEIFNRYGIYVSVFVDSYYNDMTFKAYVTDKKGERASTTIFKDPKLALSVGLSKAIEIIKIDSTK